MYNQKLCVCKPFKLKQTSHNHTRQKWSLFSIYFAELCFNMFLCQDVKVFVHQLAPHKLVSVEVTHHILRLFSGLKELLLIIQF